MPESAKESLNDHLRLRNDDLMAENRRLRNQLDSRVRLADSERQELAKIAAKLRKKALAEIATVAQPDTILARSRKFANQKMDPSERSKSVGHPRLDQEIEDWVIRMARVHPKSRGRVGGDRLLWLRDELLVSSPP